MTSPTQLSLRLLRRAGWLAEVVERWNQHAGKRQDLFGFIDLLAIRADKRGALAVQTTTRPHQADRLAKLLALDSARVWLLAGNRVQVHGWKKEAGRWRASLREVTLEDWSKT